VIFDLSQESARPRWFVVQEATPVSDSVPKLRQDVFASSRSGGVWIKRFDAGPKSRCWNKAVTRRPLADVVAGRFKGVGNDRRAW
jgi:hypothetical protein